MGDTRIAWTDKVWNPASGCSPVSAGCLHCYAAAFASRQMGPWKGRSFHDVRCHEDRLDAPLHWRKPRRVFVNSMSDLFHPAAPDAFIDKVFAVMALAPQHTFQILTKRPERMREYFNGHRRQRVIDAGERMKPSRPPEHWYYASDWSCRTSPWPLSNVWLGVSVEDQPTADARIIWLLDTPAAKRFVSYEPALNGVDLTNLTVVAEDGHRPRVSYNALTGQVAGPDEIRPERLDWVIVGGESGPGARPCRIEWIESIVAQCRAASVPVFCKQLGAYPVWAGAASSPIEHGRGANSDPERWPADLNVRECPR